MVSSARPLTLNLKTFIYRKRLGRVPTPFPDGGEEFQMYAVMAHFGYFGWKFWKRLQTFISKISQSVEPQLS